jgi:hypothetical protein
MVRPVDPVPAGIVETVKSRVVHICISASEIPWAMIAYLRTANLLHGVLVPVIDNRYKNILQEVSDRI